jgi:aldose 1-epimerase
MARCSYEYDRDEATGYRIVRMRADGDTPETNTIAQIMPEMGSNLSRLAVGGTEYIYGISEANGRAFVLGTPILYPTPNRVRDAQFTFGGKVYRFTPNNGPNFLHGLVREELWEIDEPIVGMESVSVTTRISFDATRGFWESFPIRNTLELTYTLRAGTLRLSFTVTNEDSYQLLPFGLGIHPFFRIHGSRDDVRIQVPAEKWMEAEDLLPTGRLIDVEEGPADLREPTPLTNLDLDDVYWGLSESRPQTIYYDRLGKKVVLTAADFFTHSVVYTPLGHPYFCIENQSSSTDAHNLYSQGLEKEAHLTVLPPGASVSAWIEIAVSDL